MELEAHRPLLRGLAYRITGSLADADEIVQETFARCIDRPPSLEAPLRPWLVRVACNLARDRLRARRRRAYPGTWLPTPTELVDPGPDPEERERLAQSATLAWLVAAEALTPEQRAVVVLRDVLDWTVDDTAAALARSPESVRALHHRARRALAGAPLPTPTPDVVAAHRRALEAVLGAALTGQVDAVRALLAPDVVFLSDPGGQYAAAQRPVYGADRVARLLVGLARKAGTVVGAELVELNGLPAVRMAVEPRYPSWAPRVVLAVACDAQGRPWRVFNVLADAKLAYA